MSNLETNGASADDSAAVHDSEERPNAAASAGAAEPSAATGRATDDPLAALEQGLQDSTLAETPDVNIQEYLAAKKRMARMTTSILKFATPIVIVLCVLGYMRVTGHLSLNGVLHRKQKPDPNALPPSFSVTATGPGGQTSTAATNLGAIVHTKKDPYLAQDLTNYVYHDLKTISPHERAALTAFYSVVGRNYTSQSATFETVREKVMPDYEQFVKGAETIHPKTPEVQALHLLFLRSAQVKELAFKHIEEGQSDPSGMWQFGVKAEFAASANFANQFKTRISALAQDQGVKLP